MKKHVDNIINKTNYDTNCRGLQSVNDATIIVKHHFTKESISFDNWKVTEIPLVDDSNEYPVAVVIIICNNIEKKEISLCVTLNGELECVCPGEAEIELKTITEAIAHPAAKY